MEEIDCKIKLLEFRPDSEFQHVCIIDPQICKNCNEGICLTICPSGVFKRNDANEDAPVTVRYKQCMECGACRLICPQNNILFQFPNGGYGVIFNDGVSVYPHPMPPLKRQ